MQKTSKQHDKEDIILVDPFDRKIGVMEKLLAHEYGMLHRAFSVFVFRTQGDKIETLLQQRHPNKYHGGNLWSNACCSHPHHGEELIEAAQRRLKDEMGFTVKLEEIGKFHYIAQFPNGMTENEIDHVMIGSFEENDIRFNEEEVADFAWIEVSALQDEIKKQPTKYTPWLSTALDIAVRAYKKKYD